MVENVGEENQEVDATERDPADLVFEILVARKREGGLEPVSVDDKIRALRRLEKVFEDRAERTDGEPKYVKGAQLFGAVSASLGQALREGAQADLLRRDQQFRGGRSGTSKTQPPGTGEPPASPSGPAKK